MDESQQKRLTVISELSLRFNFLASADNAVEAKAGVLLGFEVAIGFAFWAEKFFELGERKIFVASFGLLFLACSAYFLLKIMWPKTYASGVFGKENIKTHIDLPLSEMLGKVIVSKEKIVSKNADVLKEKVSYFKNAIISFGMAILLLALSVNPQVCL